MKRLALLALAPLAAFSTAGVWVSQQVTTPQGGGEVGFAPNTTVLTEYEVGPTPKKLRELSIGGYHLDTVSIKPDGSEVVGSFRQEGGGTKWVIYNFKLMEKESKVSYPAPPPGWEIVDMQEHAEGVTMLTHKGEAYRAFTQANGSAEWPETFSTVTGDLSSLPGFPYATTGDAALDAVKTLPFVDIPRAQPKEKFTWWEFFGPKGGSELGGYDPATGVIAVRSKTEGTTLQIARSSAGKALPPLKVDTSKGVTQIRVLNGLTYLCIAGGTIKVFGQNGAQVCELSGNRVVGP